MAIDWDDDDRCQIERGIKDHGLQSGRCAALARIVYRVAVPRDPATRGIQIKPRGGARWLVPAAPHMPQWRSHTYVETMAHAVDAVTGPPGHGADIYVKTHWKWSEAIDVRIVDVATIDPGIEDVEGSS